MMKEEPTGPLPALSQLDFLPPCSSVTHGRMKEGILPRVSGLGLSQFSWVEIHPLSELMSLGPLTRSQSWDPGGQILTP